MELNSSYFETVSVISVVMTKGKPMLDTEKDKQENIKTYYYPKKINKIIKLQITTEKEQNEGIAKTTKSHKHSSKPLHISNYFPH